MAGEACATKSSKENVEGSEGDVKKDMGSSVTITLPPLYS